MKLKVFVNILVETDAYSDKDAIEDAVVHAVESEGLTVKWHKSSEAND